MNNRKFISAIIPIFNEEKTIAKIIKTLLKSDLIDEVVCVNDGSTDQSLTILKNFKNKIKLVNLKKNQGKGFALVEGIKKAKGEIIFFIDADLTTFSHDHIQTLLEPVLKNKFRVVLGYPANPTDKWYRPNIFQNLTGERVYYKKDLIPYLKKMAKTRFGVEIFLNDLFNQKEIKKIPLKHLIGLYKYEKHDPKNAFKEYLKEGIEIARAIGRREGLLPMDKQIIDKLAKITDFDEFKKKISKLRSKQIKQFFEKYILKYIKI